MEIENAKITNVSISMADYCSLVFKITVEGSGWGCCIGNYKIASGMLGAKPEDFKAESGGGLVAIMRIMDTVGVDKWEDLVGKYCRVKVNGWGGTIHCIGNILDDKWFDLKDFFSTYGKKIDYDEPKDDIQSQLPQNSWIHSPCNGCSFWHERKCNNNEYEKMTNCPRYANWLSRV